MNRTPDQQHIKEFREGLNACRQFYADDPYLDDKVTPPNPYPDGSPEALAWRQGWNSYWHPSWSEHQ